jgi:hypothetical protein
MAITVVCTCGKQLQVKDEYAGKRGKCSACGSVLVIPSPTLSELFDPFGNPQWARPNAPEPLRADETLDAKAKNSREYLLWAGFAVGLVSLVVGLIFSFNKHQRDSAYREVARLVEEARESASRSKWDEAIEQTRVGLNTKNATQKDEARQLLAELEMSKAIEHAERDFSSAKKALDAGQTDEAMRLLKLYQGNSYAVNTSEAKKLSNSIEFLSSDAKARDILERTNDAELGSVDNHPGEMERMG